jgi:hypothetical protein
MRQFHPYENQKWTIFQFFGPMAGNGPKVISALYLFPNKQ